MAYSCISQLKKKQSRIICEAYFFQIFSSLKLYVLSGLLQGRERSFIYDLLQSLCIAIGSTRLLSLRISNMAYCVNLFLKKSKWCINDNKMDLNYFIMWTRNTRWLPLHEIKPCWTNLLIVSSSGTTQCIINHTWINSSLHCFLKWCISIGDLRQSMPHRSCWKIYKTCYVKKHNIIESKL